VLWDRLYRLKADGVTLVITTHYMDEAEQLCDRLVVMDGGRIAAEGSPRALIEAHASREVLELRFVDGVTDKAVDTVRDLGGRVEVLPDRVLVYTDDGDAAADAVARSPLVVASALVRRASLEDVFLTLTGRRLVD
jgi:lipooligosaccharide transport system ATP-binding protein